MKLFFIIIFSVITTTSYCQIFKQKTIETDSSTIKIRKNGKYYEISEKSKTTGLTHEKDFFVKDSILYREGWGDSTRAQFGIWKTYNNKGKWLNSIDYSNNTWEYNKALYPFSDLQENAKIKGDSLIIQTYGKEFFEKHIGWNILFGPSIIFKNNHILGDWTEPVKEKPLGYKMQYDVRFDGRNYLWLIQFALDSNGKLIPDRYTSGFEKLPGSSPQVFTLTHKDALIKAEQNGLVKTDSSEIEGLLRFDFFNRSELFSGQFQYYITQRLRSKRTDGSDKDTYIITNYYFVWIFNPWTGEFINHKEMKRIEIRRSGPHTMDCFTDLIDLEDPGYCY